MGKVSTMYLNIDPYQIIEEGYHQDRHQVSESIFSLANEYMGVRDFFEEGYTGQQLIGTYFNGIIENSLEETPTAYKGIAKRSHFMVNSVNFFKCKLCVDGEELNLANASFKDFRRVLDMRTGLLTREFVWFVKGHEIKIKFARLLDMVQCENAMQQIILESKDDVRVHLVLYLDSSIVHWGAHCYWDVHSFIKKNEIYGLSAKTISSHQWFLVSYNKCFHIIYKCHL